MRCFYCCYHYITGLNDAVKCYLISLTITRMHARAYIQPISFKDKSSESSKQVHYEVVNVLDLYNVI